MTVKLTGNFLATARCLIYLDGNAITWTFDPNTNELTAAYTGAGSAGSHNPTASIGLTAVNGTATTWMTSDSAPALSQAITPTWTGAHIFSSNVTLNGELIDGVGSAGTSTYVLSSTGTGVKWVAASSGGSGTVTSVTVSSSGSTINVTGTNPITTSGTVNVDVNSVSYDSFILGLPAASALTGSEVVAVEQSGAGAQTTVAAIASLARAGAAAVPGNIPDLQFWWESDNILGAAGAVITRLQERTPWIGGLAASASLSNQGAIAIDSGTLNGLPVLKWPAGASSGAYAIPSPASTTIPTGATGFYFNNGATYFVVAKGSTATGTQAILGGTTGALSLYLVSVSGTAKIGLVKTGASVIGSSSTAWTAGAWFQANATYIQGTGAYVFRQGRAAAGSGTGATGAGVTAAEVTNILGGDVSSSSFLNAASVAAIIVYNRVLSSTEITEVENYLNAKWGV